ncbi:putative acetyltransferase [Cohaesibacter sp. ES.047]|uniref:GNAT family N-acetyltransferase n=1 Tax=Cohaesibacter sp. ES.047 TaxID=1798205 RepID=UPI000BB7462D|nr:GNAT family N-acetyltransferase [Cohaesibacter sp. ES.047]SNY90611.1 putative acetyltransferase [Cohaesibacter sp. ES.047]
MIRKFTSEDKDAAIALWRSASDLAHSFLPADFMEEAERLTRDTYLDLAETWVYEIDGKVVGFIGLLDNLVGGLFVDPLHHGKGIGRALVDKGVEEKGALVVEVFVDNSIGRGFYAAYGFTGNKQVTDPNSGFPLLQLTYEPKS